MSPLKTYKHKDTGKVGEYSDAVAALFPKLEPFEVADEAAIDEAPATAAPVSTETTGGDAKSKGKADQ